MGFWCRRSTRADWRTGSSAFSLIRRGSAAWPPEPGPSRRRSTTPARSAPRCWQPWGSTGAERSTVSSSRTLGVAAADGRAPRDGPIRNRVAAESAGPDLNFGLWPPQRPGLEFHTVDGLAAAREIEGTSTRTGPQDFPHPEAILSPLGVLDDDVVHLDLARQNRHQELRIAAVPGPDRDEVVVAAPLDPFLAQWRPPSRVPHRRWPTRIRRRVTLARVLLGPELDAGPAATLQATMAELDLSDDARIPVEIDRSYALALAEGLDGLPRLRTPIVEGDDEVVER